jgi:hypothetical protein
VKKKFDIKSHPMKFKNGNLGLMWNKRDMKPREHKQNDNLYLDPITNEDVVILNYFYLIHIDGENFFDHK